MNYFEGEIQSIAFNFVDKEIVIDLQTIGQLFGQAQNVKNA